MCTVLLPQSVNPTAVNKYIYHIIYHAMELLDINTVCTEYRNNYHSIITRQQKQQF